MERNYNNIMERTPRYNQIVKRLPEGFTLLRDYGNHNCELVFAENANRISGGESAIYIFKDLESQKWNIRVGIEFISVKFCPFCGKMVEE